MKYVFTFGANHTDANGFTLGNSYVIIDGVDFDDARQKMLAARGYKWSWQYHTEEEAGVERFKLQPLTLEQVTLDQTVDND